MSARSPSPFRQNRAFKCEVCGKHTRRLGLFAHIMAKHREEVKANARLMQARFDEQRR